MSSAALGARLPAIVDDATPQLTLDVVESDEGLAALEAEWRALETRASRPNVFLTYDWVATWWRHYHAAPGWGTMSLHVVVIRDGRRIRAIVPLVRRCVARTQGLVRKLELIGGGDLPAYHGWLVDGDEPTVVAALAEHLAATQDRWDLVELVNLPADAADLVGAALRRAGLRVRAVAGEDTRRFPVSTTWDARIDRSWRRFIARKSKRLAELVAPDAPVRFVASPIEAAELFDELVRLERQKIVNGEMGEPLLAGRPAFFREILARFAGTDRLCLAVIARGKRVIAFELAFVVGDELWAYTSAYDAEFAVHSPGTVVMGHVVAHAAWRGCAHYDFLRGGEAYKARWKPTVRPTTIVQVRSGRARSRVASLVYFGGQRLARRLRAPRG